MKQPKPLKVYGGTNDGTHREIVAAKNKTQAAKALDVSIHVLNTWFCETGNDLELEVALSKPGTVFRGKDGLFNNMPEVKEDFEEWIPHALRNKPKNN